MDIYLHPRQMKDLQKHFSNCNPTAFHYALRFKTKSFQASLIRCYAMNFLEKAVFVRDS